MFNFQAADTYSQSSQGCIATSCCAASSQSNKKCCKDKNVSTTLNISQRSGKYNVVTGTYYPSASHQKTSQLKQNVTQPDSCWTDFPKIILLSVGSMVLPIGYSNDFRQHHPRIKVSRICDILFNVQAGNVRFSKIKDQNYKKIQHSDHSNYFGLFMSLCLFIVWSIIC